MRRLWERPEKQEGSTMLGMCGGGVEQAGLEGLTDCLCTFASGCDPPRLKSQIEGNDALHNSCATALHLE